MTMSSKTAMQDDPIEKMRKAFDDAKTKAELKEFVLKHEETRLENDWQKFINAVINPAFARVKIEFCDKFKLKLQDLEEQPTNPGFKVQDFHDTEFQFWIELRGRFPKLQARRKYGKTPGAVHVPADLFNSKPNLDLTDVTEDDVVCAIVRAYQHSVRNFQ